MDESELANDYELLEELGSGSFGIVYKAIERATGDVVAIKHIDLESSEEDIAEIQQEINVLSTCASSFVTQYRTSFLRGSKLWIVMEYLGGGSCQDLLKPGAFPEQHVAIVCRELLRGLGYLHGEGKIHRDVKAANILLSHNGAVKLADFGVAAQLSNLQSVRNTFVGTPFWMAPEVIQEAGYDARADIWSLGITAMEMVNGEPPNAAIHPMKVLFLIPKQPAPRLEGSQYSRDLKDFVAACLVRDPDYRPSAKELLQHRFIRNAGRVEKLQELIQRRRLFDQQQGVAQHPRFYAETMVSMSPVEEKDEWVFDTIKAPTVAIHTDIEKPRQVTSSTTDTLVDTTKSLADDMRERLTLTAPPYPDPLPSATPPSTMRRLSTKRRASTSAVLASPSKRKASNPSVRAPLAPDLSFGNQGSTVRQFRRVSDNSPNVSPEGTLERSDENRPPLAEITEVASASKEALLGRRAYAKAVDGAFQEAYAQTANRAQREALAKVAQAWNALDRVDPAGEFQLLRLMMEKVASDPKLSAILSTTSQPGTSQKPKLVLAQNNPHLKSHKRRQSSVLSTTQDLLDDEHLPGQAAAPGMEHTAQLADVLYNKWVDGLRNRWPAV